MTGWQNWENIQICMVETPSLMWMRNIDLNQHPLYQKFKEFQRQLDATFHRKNHEINSDTLEKNKPAVVKYGDSWCRCIILDMDRTHAQQTFVDVFLVDYGNQLNVPSVNVFPLSPGSWQSVPYLCRKIELINTTPSEICWTAEDGTPGLHFRPGNFWSVAAIRFMKQIAATSNKCTFHPFVRYVATSNETSRGHVYLEITQKIREVIYSFHYDKTDQLTESVNLADLLVDCNMAVLFEEPVTQKMNQTKIDAKVGKSNNFPENSKNAIRKESHDMNRPNILPVLEKTMKESMPNNDGQFRMSLSAFHNKSNESPVPKMPLPIMNPSSIDLHDIPLPSEPAITGTFPQRSSQTSSIEEIHISQESAFIPNNYLTGYEKMVKTLPAKLVDQNTVIESSPVKSDSEKNSATKTIIVDDKKSDLDTHKADGQFHQDKKKSEEILCTAYPNISHFMRPMFDLAKIMRVYNGGKISVPRHELILDEADSRKVINRKVWEILKQEGQFLVLPLQTFMWPTVVRGRSCVAIERRARGKTLGYVIPLVSQILDTISILSKYAPSHAGPVAIIVCPGWSSVNQVTRYMENFTKFTNVRVAAVYGGMSKCSGEEDRKAVFSVDILVTTMPSLPRLGMTLIEEKSPMDESIPGISLEKCSFLVLDNYENIYPKFPSLTDCLLDKWLATVQQNETVKQLIITSKQWNNDIEKVTDKIEVVNPNIIISSIFEAAVATLVKTRLDCCKTDPLVSQAVCDAICDYPGTKIIVFLDGHQQTERLEELLYTRAIGAIRVASADRPVVKRATDLWANSISCVMLIMETAVIEYMSSDIKDADVIIHASVPPSSHNLGMRYSYMLNKFENVERGQATCISHFILTPDMISRKPQIIPELQRLGIEIANKVKNAYEQGIHLQKKNAASKDMCFTFKSFGKCSQQYCPFRHYITPGDEPKLVPTEGQVKLEIIDVVSASCFLARIRCYKSTTERITNLEKVYQRMHNKLQEFYGVKENRRGLHELKLGSLCALERQSWVRGEIIKIDFSESRVIYTVKTIDERGLEQRSTDFLYQLPDDMLTIPPLAVEVFLSSIRPMDEDTEFTQYTKHLASTRLMNENVKTYFTAMVRFALRNTLFVDELVEIRTIAKVPTETSYLVREFLQCKVAATNPFHLENLAVDDSNRAVHFEGNGESWLKKYTLLENPFNTAASDEVIVDVQKQEDINGKDGMSCVSGDSGSSTVVDSTIRTTSETSGSKSATKINALRSLLRRSLLNYTSSDNKLVPKEETNGGAPTNEVDLLNSNSTIGPAPPCYTPPRKDSIPDLDEIMSYSNFDIVSRYKEPSCSDVSSSLCTAKSISLTVNQEIEVIVDEIYSPKSFFVVLNVNIKMLETMEDKIQAKVKKCAPFDPDETLSGLYVAQFTDGLYYRAKLTDVQEGSCTVHFVDHGERMVLSWDKIQKCPSTLCKVPFQAIHCELHGISVPKKKLISAKHRMEELVDERSSWFIKPITIHHQTQDAIIHAVSLYSKDDKETFHLAKSLIDEGFAEPCAESRVKLQTVSDEQEDLRNERLKRLINERNLAYSPTDTIKDYFKEENESFASEITSNEKDSSSSPLSPATSIVSALKRISLNARANCTANSARRGESCNSQVGSKTSIIASPACNTPSGSKTSIIASEACNTPSGSNNTIYDSPGSNTQGGSKTSNPDSSSNTEGGSDALRVHTSSSDKSRIHTLSTPVTIRHPPTTWKDSNNMIIIRFKLIGVHEYDFDTSDTCVHFSTTLNGHRYTFSEKLFSKIDTETVHCKVQGTEVVIKFCKQSNGAWPRLLSITGTIPWLRRDVLNIEDTSVCSSSFSQRFY